MDAPASITCPDCRARWLCYHDQEIDRYIEHTPVGYIKLTVEDATQPVIRRSFADVRAAIKPPGDGAMFRIDCVAVMIVVGQGSYIRQGSGVAVLFEDGAAEVLHLALREAIPVEKTDTEPYNYLSVYMLLLLCC